MFNSQHPHTTTARTGHLARRIGAGVVSVALAGGFALAGAASAQALDSAPVAVSSAQFLSGSLLGTNLDNVVKLEGASASARPGDPTDTQKDPLEVTALNSINVGDGSSIQTSLGQFLQLGAIGQYATANQNGSSMAWTGGVSKDGGVGIGQDSPIPGGDATVNLSSLLGSGFATNLTDLQLAISAVSAQAITDGTNAQGDYDLAGADLHFTSPAIADLTEKVNTALDSVTNRLSSLDGSDGKLAADVNRLLVKLNPALNVLGAGAHVTATIDTGDLKSLVQDLLTTQYGGTGVSFNLETGIVTLNLGELLGEDLGNLPPGTELLKASVIDPVLQSVTTKISGIADQVVDRVKTALNNATVTIHADLSQNVAQAPLVKQVCNIVQKVIQVPTQTTIQVPVINGTLAPIVNGVPIVNGIPIVGGLLSGTTIPLASTVTGTLTYVTQTVTQLVNQTVTQNVCNNQTTALPALNTSAVVDITGTVGEFLQGAGVTAKASAQVLGVSLPPINLDVATSDITKDLSHQLFDSDSAVTDLVNALNTGLVNPALEGLTDGTDSVNTALSDLLSITVNNQSVDNGTFTETAVQVSVLPNAASGLLGGHGFAREAASSPVAQVNLARASVGPSVTGDVGGVDTNPPTGDPGSIGNPSNFSQAASTIGRLATTGAGIAALVAAVLALLAAGAYLVREGYRRNRSVVVR